MRNQLLFKIYSLIFSLFVSQTAFAQATSASTQQPSPQKNQQPSQSNVQPANTTQQAKPSDQDNTVSSLMKNSALIEKVSGSVADTLLSNKVTSLMFDDDENNNINRAIDSLKNNQIYTPEGAVANNNDEKEAQKADDQAEENEKSYLFLASIIYFSPRDWAIWINDQKITPLSNKKENELYAKEVTRDYVRFVWNLSVSKWKILSGKISEELAPKVNKDNQVEVNFALKQNQTFILSTGSVVEGRAVIALLKKREEEKKVAKAKKENGNVQKAPEAQTEIPATQSPLLPPTTN